MFFSFPHGPLKARLWTIPWPRSRGPQMVSSGGNHGGRPWERWEHPWEKGRHPWENHGTWRKSRKELWPWTAILVGLAMEMWTRKHGKPIGGLQWALTSWVSITGTCSELFNMIEITGIWFVYYDWAGFVLVGFVCLKCTEIVLFWIVYYDWYGMLYCSYF